MTGTSQINNPVGHHRELLDKTKYSDGVGSNNPVGHHTGLLQDYYKVRGRSPRR